APISPPLRSEKSSSECRNCFLRENAGSVNQRLTDLSMSAEELQADGQGALQGRDPAGAHRLAEALDFLVDAVRGDLDGRGRVAHAEHRDREDGDHDGELDDDESEAHGDEGVHGGHPIKIVNIVYMPEARTDWSSTVRLPKTDFPMKG